MYPHSGPGSDTSFLPRTTQVVSLTNPTENGVSTVKSFLTSAIAAHITPLIHYFMLIAWSKAALWSVCLLFTGCAAEENDSDFSSHIQWLSHADQNVTIPKYKQQLLDTLPLPPDLLLLLFRLTLRDSRSQPSEFQRSKKVYSLLFSKEKMRF